MKNFIIVSCILVCSSALFGMNEEIFSKETKKKMQLIVDLSNKLRSQNFENSWLPEEVKKKNENAYKPELLKRFDEVVEERIPNTVYGNPTYSVILSGVKKENWQNKIVKEELIKLYNQDSDYFEEPIKLAGLKLGMDVNEEANSVKIILLLKENSQQETQENSGRISAFSDNLISPFSDNGLNDIEKLKDLGLEACTLIEQLQNCSIKASNIINKNSSEISRYISPETMEILKKIELLQKNN